MQNTPLSDVAKAVILKKLYHDEVFVIYIIHNIHVVKKQFI